MIEQKHHPNYKLKYMECTHDKSHQGECLNLVCLNESCFHRSLICSMCKNTEHKGHNIKPLKFYLSDLKVEYDENRRDYDSELEVLEETRFNFLTKFKETVEKVAEEFKKMEEQSMQKFEVIKNQILDKKTKKNKFNDFYQSLIKEQDQNASFLIQNYLPTEELGFPSDFSKFDHFYQTVSQQVNDLRGQFLSQNIKIQQIQQVQPKDNSFILAKTITKKNNVFHQTNISKDAPKMNLMNMNLVKDLGAKKIKVKATKIKKGSILTVGAITKTLFNSLNFKSPENWYSGTHNNELFFYNNKGQIFGHKKSQLKTFSQGSSFVFSMNKNQMKIQMNKQVGQFSLPKEKDFYFFFCVEGNTDVEIVVD